MSRTDLVVGNDSGMMHLAGLMGVKGLALTGPTHGETVFNWYNCIETMQAPGDCTACYYAKERKYKPWCIQGCGLLMDMKAPAVFERVEKIMEEQRCEEK
jgi:hypothetical protein